MPASRAFFTIGTSAAAVDHVLDRGDLRRRVAGGVGFGGHDVEPILLCRVDGGFFEPVEERIGKLQLDNADQKLLFLGLHGAWHETGANARQRDRASCADRRAAGFRILTLWHVPLLLSSRRLTKPTLSVRGKPKPDCSPLAKSNRSPALPNKIAHRFAACWDNGRWLSSPPPPTCEAGVIASRAPPTSGLGSGA